MRHLQIAALWIGTMNEMNKNNTVAFYSPIIIYY